MEAAYQLMPLRRCSPKRSLSLMRHMMSQAARRVGLSSAETSELLLGATSFGVAGQIFKSARAGALPVRRCRNPFVDWKGDHRSRGRAHPRQLASRDRY
jgi:hypothetical protein